MHAAPGSAPQSPEQSFEAANLLYEQGQFNAAADAYRALLKDGRGSASLHYNLANALFKCGQVGRAIYHYRVAQLLAPRDPDVRANLQFARNSLAGSALPTPPWWSRWAQRLSLNEWGLLTVGAFWLTVSLAILGQLRPALRRQLRTYQRISGAVLLLTAMGSALVAYEHLGSHTAIVAEADTTVHYGPLEESQQFYVLSDGAEVEVVDHKGEWLQVIDRQQRVGWIRQQQAVLFP
jgi:tetratricopeptide (TPR) repeat protein